MASPFPRITLVFPLLTLALVLTDCHCGTTKFNPVACSSGAKACTIDSDCADHEACGPQGGEQCCTFAARTCKDSSECCPGQICKRDGHCFDQRVECPNGDSDCGDPGSDRVCLPYSDGRGATDQVCGYAACDNTGACADGLSCFRGFCVASAPCGGHCDDGSICIPQTNTCWSYGERCTISCGAGFLAMEKDPTNIWDSCNNRNVDCECDELPPLQSNDLGRYASSAPTAGGAVAVSMYDGQYGDLVVRTYAADGTVQGTEYVDGVPSSGTVVAGPSGARGGIADPGDDVGQFTSIAADPDGRLFVSYYDVTHGDLKLAIRAAGGGWTTQTIDSAGDVGLYTSIALDGSGKPTLAYFQRAGAAGGTSCPAANANQLDLVTGVKLARASSANPASASDWTVSFVECGARPPPACYGCTSNQVCVGSGTCAPRASGCSACASTEVCANTGSGASCQTAFTSKPLLDTPLGVGLYPSLAFNGNSAVVVYYDSRTHQLKGATGTGALTSQVIDGCGNAGCDDVGMFANVAIEPTGQHRIAIAYHDATSRKLVARIGSGLGNGVPAIVDTGLEPPTADGPSFVGANVNLHFGSDGKLWAAYQNSTGNDLRLAAFDGSTWSVQKKWTQGALGWFAHIAELPGAPALYVSHTRLHTKLQQGHPVKDTSPQMTVYTP